MADEEEEDRVARRERLRKSIRAMANMTMANSNTSACTSSSLPNYPNYQDSSTSRTSLRHSPGSSFSSSIDDFNTDSESWVELSPVWNELRDERQLCDGLLHTANGGNFYVHRAILAALSPFFRSLFIDHVPDATEITLPQFNYQEMSSLLEYIYTGHCEVTEKNAQDLLVSANMMEVNGLIQLCMNVLINNLRNNNCISIFQFSRNHTLPKLENTARRYILCNFKQVMNHSREYNQLSALDLQQFLEDDMLNVQHEETTFKAVKRWVNFQPQERAFNVRQLLACMRFGLMSRHYFTTVVMQWEQVTQQPEVQEDLQHAARFLEEQEELEDMQPELGFREWLVRPRIGHEVLFAVGGWLSSGPTNIIETYDARAKRWLLSPDNDSIPCGYHSVVALGSCIFLLGGYDGQEYFNTMRCYDTNTRQWSDRACMYYRRCYVSACTIGNVIYAMGGFDGARRLNSAEMYLPEENQWRRISSMHAQRSDASASSLNGKIYIAGGFNGHQVLNTAEMYDPKIDQWSAIANLISPRSGISTVAYHSYIYVIGGFNGVTRLNTVERYNPQSNTWHPVGSMLGPRSNFSSVVLDDMIFSVGGYNGNSTIRFVECYDGYLDQWFDAASMSLNRSALSLCVVKEVSDIHFYSYLWRMQEESRRIINRPMDTWVEENEIEGETTEEAQEAAYDQEEVEDE